MTTFTIDNENNFSLFASQEEAAASSGTPFDSFTTEQELAELAAAWPDARLVAIWNSLPGAKPAKSEKVKDRRKAIARIWGRIQSLGEPSPEVEAAAPGSSQLPATQVEATVVPSEGASVPTKPKATKKVTPAKAAPKNSKAPEAKPEVAPAPSSEPPAAPPQTEVEASQPASVPAKPKAPKKAPKTPEPAAPRESSKTAQVVAMLQRDSGATITEIMSTMSWQRHTVRGFMAGAMKKAGHTIESFKPEGGERSYRITK